MQRLKDIVILAAVGGLLWLAWDRSQPKPDEQVRTPTPAPVKPTPPKKPEPPRKPWATCGAPVGADAASVGRTAPDGTEPQIDLPGNLHTHNTSSKGLGNCVFTSIHHAAHWQDVPLLQGFPQWLISSGIPGGGSPSKVDDLVARIAREKGVPVPKYLQVEGNDVEILKLACKTGRMPAVTYGHSPTGRYGGRSISHMVSLVHADDSRFAVLDNNYPGPDKVEWMSPAQFLSAYKPGWCFILLDPGPPPPPKSVQTDEPQAVKYSLTTARGQAEPSGYTWYKPDDKQLVLMGPQGQVGNYWLTGERAGTFTRLVNGEWSKPCAAPISVPEKYLHAAWQNLARDCPAPVYAPSPKQQPTPEPPAVDPDENGVDRDKLAHLPPGYWCCGRKVSREEALATLGKVLPDDSALLRLTVIGSAAERKQVLADLATSPALQQWRDKLVVRDYPPEHWAVKDAGFATDGAPTIYLQTPAGQVLHRQSDYEGGADKLAQAIRRADPNYVPAKDPDKRKPDPSPLEPLKSIPPWAYGLGAVALIALSARRVKP